MFTFNSKVTSSLPELSGYLLPVTHADSTGHGGPLESHGL